MGTPLKQVKFLLSPKVLQGPRVLLSPKVPSPVTPRNIRNSPCIVGKLDFGKAMFLSPNRDTAIANNATPCESPPKNKRSYLLVNTPNKSEILKHGLKSGSNFSVLGRGTFGTVVRGIYKNETVAVKVIKTKPKVNEWNGLQLGHSNVVKTRDVMTKNQEYSLIIMEYLEGGRQLQALLDDDDCSWIGYNRVVRFSTDITEGLKYCHENGVLHLDLKPANVLVCVDGRCKICDFGSSRLSGDTDQDYVHQGTVVYTAPEILLGKTPTFSSDVYSLGITFWQLRYRKLPFEQLQNKDIIIYKVVKYGLRPSVEGTKKLEDPFCDLYEACWLADPNRRPALTAVLVELNKLRRNQ